MAAVAGRCRFGGQRSGASSYGKSVYSSRSHLIYLSVEKDRI